MISDCFIRKVFDSRKSIRGIKNQKAQKERKWDSVSYKLHEGAAENLPHLPKQCKAEISHIIVFRQLHKDRDLCTHDLYTKKNNVKIVSDTLLDIFSLLLSFFCLI